MAKNLSGNRQIPPPIGFELDAYDGGIDGLGAYWGMVPISGIHCPRCYSTLDFTYVSRSVKIRGSWDIAHVEGRNIVGERFRKFCIASKFEDVDLPCVDAKNRYYELRPTRILEVDIGRSQPLLMDFCTTCGNFESYLHGRGLFIAGVTSPLPEGIYRTDLVFGCRAGKHPRIVIAPNTMRKLKAMRLRKLQFSPVPNVDPHFERRKADIDAVYEQIRNERTAATSHRT